MHVCLTSIELFGFGVHGGFGRSTRFIGRELVRRGIEVTVVVPRRSAIHADVTEVDGMTVRQYDPRFPWAAVELFRCCGADVYHSQDTSLGTYLAGRAAPDRRHVVTFRDPLDDDDWRVETELSGQGRLGWTGYRLFIDNPLVALAIGEADALYCAARFLIPKVVRKYGLLRRPGFLPTPVAIPPAVRKAKRPTVCFVGRWDGRKRPELFFELAREVPGVDFVAVGGAQDPERDGRLRERASTIPNLRTPGFLDQFRSGALGEVLERSWVIVNTSPREGLPVSFLEAAAHGCALLSHTDPDGFASRFGRHVPEGRLREGLEDLLENDRWRPLGELGRAHVAAQFSVEKAMEAHLAVYAGETV